MHICVKKAGATIAQRFVKSGEACRTRKGRVGTGLIIETRPRGGVVGSYIAPISSSRLSSITGSREEVRFHCTQKRCSLHRWSKGASCDAATTTAADKTARQHPLSSHHAALLAHQLAEEPLCFRLRLVLLVFRGARCRSGHPSRLRAEPALVRARLLLQTRTGDKPCACVSSCREDSARASTSRASSGSGAAKQGGAFLRTTKHLPQSCTAVCCSLVSV